MLTIGYITNRRDPKVEWFCDSLYNQLREKALLNDVQVIFVDFFFQYESEQRSSLYAKAVGERFRYVLTHPKPSAWQGKYKLTKRDHFAASNARNTVFSFCENDFVAFADDLSVLRPGWLDQVLHAKAHGYCVLGSYKKVKDLVVEDGEIKSFTPFEPGVDSRWNKGSDSGIVPAGGSWLFGCSFALPLELALRINGFEEKCDGTGMEDVEFGIRLERVGCKLFYNRNMCTFESEEHHVTDGNQKFVRESIMTPNGIMSDWVIYNNVVFSKKSWADGNDFKLRELRDKIRSGQSFPIPEKDYDWRTGGKLSEMKETP